MLEQHEVVVYHRWCRGPNHPCLRYWLVAIEKAEVTTDADNVLTAAVESKKKGH